MYTRSNPNCFETVISLIWISWLKYKTIDHRCQNVLFEIFKKVIQLGAKWSDMTFNQMKYNIYNILLFYEMPYCEILNPIPARPAVFPFLLYKTGFWVLLNTSNLKIIIIASIFQTTSSLCIGGKLVFMVLGLPRKPGENIISQFFRPVRCKWNPNFHKNLLTKSTLTSEEVVF